MHANGAAMRFVPGSGVNFQSSVLLPTVAGCGRQCSPPDFFRPCRTRRRLLMPLSLQFDFMVLRALRFEPWWRAHFPPQASNEKTPPRGATARRGVDGARGGRRVTIHRANLRHAFIKRGWLSVRYATLEPGNCFDSCPAMSCPRPERLAGPHLSSTFCAAAPATSNQHG
jgi:hypothetical protein